MSAIPEPWRDLVSELRKMKEQLRRLSNRSAFFGTGVHPTGDGGLASDAFDGDLATGDAGTTGWAANDQKMAVGELILRPGSVGNDSLTDPVETAQGHDDANNFAVGTAWTYPLSVVMPIPAGFTRALVEATVGVSANNSTASGDYLFGDISIPAYSGSLPGFTIGSALIDPGAGGISWQSTSVQLTDLSGPSFTVNGAVSTGFGSWAASTGNVANLDVTVLFTR